MVDPEQDSWAWRLAYGVAPALVIAAFLFGLRAILDPFLLFLLLALLLSPYAGTRTLLVLGGAGALTSIWVLQTTGFLLAIPLAVLAKLLIAVALERYERSTPSHGRAV